MPCFHPLPAWRTQDGSITLSRQPSDSYSLRLPCGGCLGCQMAGAKAWALRCQLELQQHPQAAFTTLTYDDAHLPYTLQKEHLSLWLKRLRRATAPTRVRFFACGEYGERTARPHYHALIFGIGAAKAPLIEKTWGKGQCRTDPVTPARVAYTAGYCAKKIGWKYDLEKFDPETGEAWQPPFRDMSRKPGIGAHARQWAQSWRLYAVTDGHKMPVPRYLHEAWQAVASYEEQEELTLEKIKFAILKDSSPARLEAGEKISQAQQRLAAEKRSLR